MTKPLNKDDRRSLAEKIMDIGNAALIGMAGSQFISGGNILIFVLGVLLALEAYVFAYQIMKGGAK